MQQQRLLIFNTGLASTLLIVNKKYAEKAKAGDGAKGGNKLDDNSKQMLKILI
jgi:hypothetical protein